MLRFYQFEGGWRDGVFGLYGLSSQQEQTMPTYSKTPDALSKLTPEQYRVTQQSDTEMPGRP